MKNSASKKVLFLSLSGIGNLIMQLPTIEAAKKAHPDWHITVWVAPRGTKAIAEVQPYIDSVLEMPIKANLFQHIQNLFTLRQHTFDIGIVLSPGQLVKSAAYLKLAGVPVRIGNSYPYKGNKENSKFLTHAILEDPKLHDIEQNLQLLGPLDIHEQSPFYSLYIPEKNIQEAEQYSGKSFIGIHAGCATGFEFKRWPLERFAEVAQELLKKNMDTKFLIFGGTDEESQKQELVQRIGVNSAESISASLLTTAAIMQHCKLFISNDSGLMHIAAAVGVPTIGIFGPTDEHQTGPRGPKSYILRAPGTKPVYTTESFHDLGATPPDTLLAITSEMVIDKIEEYALI
jgi:heptosyltransferase-2